MMWTEISLMTCEHPSFRVLLLTPRRSFRIAKSPSMELKLVVVVDLMLINKNIKKVSPCASYVLIHLNFRLHVCN